jgi:hypothetical protein
MGVVMQELISLKATNGIITLYDDKVIISRKSLGGFASQGNKGDRIIFYKDISSIEYKKPSMMANGYLQFIIPGTQTTNNKVGLFGSSIDSLKDPNTIILRAFNSEVPKKADEIYKILLDKISESRNTTAVIQKESSADEIRKYKQLLDEGIINQEEFDIKKKELLGI